MERLPSLGRVELISINEFTHDVECFADRLSVLNAEWY